jgi:dTDP-4-dehydrorhamnose reductase
MKKVLLLGSSGMLGHQVFFRLLREQNIALFDLSFRKKMRSETILCDITDFGKLAGVIQEVKPDVIVNCIGVLIKGSQKNPKNAILINSYLPHWLAEEADRIQSKVIHVSTDCVFSGKKGDYIESDFRDADDVYGRSKALGELVGEKHLTLRTSIIGPELKNDGEGLFHWFMHQSGAVNGYTRAFWGGVTTTVLANVIGNFIERDVCGVVHITNGEKISKFELLQIFNNTFNKGLEIAPFEGKLVDKSLKTSHPSVGDNVPSYQTMVSEMRNFMLANRDIYDVFYNF